MQPFQTAKHAHRHDLKVGPLGSPLLQNAVYVVHAYRLGIYILTSRHIDIS